MKLTKPRQQPVAATRTPAHELPPTLVYEILRGNERRRCLRGASHRAAVLLGIKEGELAEAA